jgi:hypothetical protein
LLVFIVLILHVIKPQDRGIWREDRRHELLAIELFAATQPN